MARHAYIPMRCATNGAVMMGDFEQAGETWDLMKADILRGRAADNPAANLDVKGVFTIDQSYPGCPSCGNDRFTQCGECGALNCWSSTTPESWCVGCSTSAPVVTRRISDLNATDMG